MSGMDSSSNHDYVSEDLNSNLDEFSLRSTKMKQILDVWYIRKKVQLSKIQSSQAEIVQQEHHTQADIKQLNERLTSLIKVKENMKLMEHTLALKQNIHAFRSEQQKMIQQLRFINDTLLPYLESKHQFQKYKKWKNDRTNEVLLQKETMLQKQNQVEFGKAKEIQEQHLSTINALKKQLAKVRSNTEAKKKKIEKLEQEKIKRENDPQLELKRLKEEKELLKQQIKEEKARQLKAIQEQQRKEHEARLKEEHAMRIQKEKEEMEQLRLELEALKNTQPEVAKMETEQAEE